MLTFVFLLMLSTTRSSAAGPETTSLPRTYVGGSFGQEFGTSPTRKGPQSKLWFQDGAWWALMLEPAGRAVRIFELRADHTWRPTGAVVNADSAETGDALVDGDALYVLIRGNDTLLRLARLAYSRQNREYVLSQPPALVTARGTREPAALAKDTTGRLWMTFASSSGVLVSYSDTDGRGWVSPFVLAAIAPGQRREVSAVVSFDNSIGVMWSEQPSGAFRFAVHKDGTPSQQWRYEVALAGPARSEPHISLKRVDGDPSDTVVAAVKTTPGDEGEPPEAPMIMVMARAGDGTWSEHNAGTVADGLNSPVLQVDETSQLYLLFDTAGSIYLKRSSLTDISFAPGRGTPLMLGDNSRLNDVTGTKQPLNARSGLVTLANGAVDYRYHHAELDLGQETQVNPNDTQAPTAPGTLTARATSSGGVSLVWSSANDGDSWAPATDGLPVRGYVVYRDGIEVGTTDQTSFGDSPPAAQTYEYAVLAFDLSGNRSPPVAVAVDVPPDDESVARAAGLALLGAAAAVTAAFVARSLFGRQS